MSTKFAALGSLTPPQEPEQMDVEEVTGKPEQPAPRLSDQIIQAEAKRVVKKKAAAPTTRGKSSSGDYEAVKVLVKTDFRNRATTKWQQQHGRKRDFSDLIEELLAGYIRA